MHCCKNSWDFMDWLHRNIEVSVNLCFWYVEENRMKRLWNKRVWELGGVGDGWDNEGMPGEKERFLSCASCVFGQTTALAQPGTVSMGEWVSWIYRRPALPQIWVCYYWFCLKSNQNRVEEGLTNHRNRNKQKEGCRHYSIFFQERIG